MNTRSSDFNYKVALAAGLKSLQAGRLRQAEEQFRYLVTHFPGADGGYRGLAKVLVEQEDRPAALRMLLDGGAATAKAGQRAGAIGLYRDAVALDPRDLTAHRRLAAALALAGEHYAAADEYVRYIQSAVASGANERARLEAEFAVERLPQSGDIARIARTLGMDVAARPAFTPPSPDNAAPGAPAAQDRAAHLRSVWGPPLEPRPTSEPTAATAPPATSAYQAHADAPVVPESVASSPPFDPWGEVVVGVLEAPATTVEPHDGEPDRVGADEQTVEAAAARYLAKRDPRGAEAALDAARRYIADGRTDAASDLLLQLISRGVADHDAQRLLVDVARSLGKRDVAKAKCQLLVQALRLDGRDDLAAEVEQLAQAE